MRTADPAPITSLRGQAIATVPDAGRVYGMSRSFAYDLARQGAFPVPVRSVGSRLYVLTADVARDLGVDPAVLLADDHSGEAA